MSQHHPLIGAGERFAHRNQGVAIVVAAGATGGHQALG